MRPVRGRIPVRLFPWPVVALVIFSACANDSDREVVVHRDSLGVQIVESHAPRSGSRLPWRVEERPRIDLAAGEGEPHEFYQVRDAARLRSGVLVVADGGSQQIRFFGSSGDFLASVGGEGEGPGEFLGVNSVAEYGADSVVVFDRRQERFTIIGPAHRVGRVTSVRTTSGRIRELQPLDDRTFVGLVALPEDPGSARTGYYRTPYAAVRVTQLGEILDTIAVVPGLGGYASSGVVASPPYQASAHLDVHDSILTIGSAVGMAFQQFSTSGALVRRVRVPSFDLTLSTAEIDRERELMMRGLRGLPSEFRRVIEDMEFPEVRPGYGDLLVDPQGFVWASGYQGRAERDDPVDWQIFDPRGEWLGKVTTPPRFDVFEIGDDYMLGTLRDQLDIEHVQILPLQRH